jgi:hypothetical protein
MRLAIASLCLFLGMTTIPAADPVEVAQTTYAELEKTIQQHAGKVVLVDVWSLG